MKRKTCEVIAAEGRTNMGCMCMECQFLRIVEDENGYLFPICANRKSKNFLTEVSLIFGSCKIGTIEKKRGRIKSY